MVSGPLGFFAELLRAGKEASDAEEVNHESAFILCMSCCRNIKVAAATEASSTCMYVCVILHMSTKVGEPEHKHEGQL